MLRLLLGRGADLKNLALFALPVRIKHSSAFCRGAFPAGFVPLMVSRANRINILRTAHEVPAGFFSFPKVGHVPPFLQSPPIDQLLKIEEDGQITSHFLLP
jgi:hypothetical protein